VPAGYGLHLPVSPAWLQDAQVPVHAPSQHTPSAQKPEAQAVAAVQGWPFLVLQAPLPSQACPSAQLPATSVPAIADTQVPSEPGTLHDLQAPVHAATSQHTPSTQLPEAQRVANSAVQPSPLPSPVTEYSQVSLPYGFPDGLPKSTATPRVLSNAMTLPYMEPGDGLGVRTYQVGSRGSTSRVCWTPVLELPGSESSTPRLRIVSKTKPMVYT
jgi:hypothetical protein